ncbi:MAG: type II toxin-antitoxin system VapC family toxin [Bryobacteraceae bacterium]
MFALLDTHALLWWFADDPALTKRARAVISDTRNTILVSAASAWEIAIKVRIGKLASAVELLDNFDGQLQQETFEKLSISTSHAIRAGLLAGIHKDPFDRVLIAQAQEENVPLISCEAALDGYGVRRIW